MANGVFQAMFWVVDQLTGIPVSFEVPSPRGPRHAGQFSAPETCNPTVNATANEIIAISSTSLNNRPLIGTGVQDAGAVAEMNQFMVLNWCSHPRG